MSRGPWNSGQVTPLRHRQEGRCHPPTRWNSRSNPLAEIEKVRAAFEGRQKWVNLML